MPKPEGRHVPRSTGPPRPVRSLTRRAGPQLVPNRAPCPSSIESSNGCDWRSFSARTCHAPIDAAGSLPRSAWPSCSRTCCSAASRSMALANRRAVQLPEALGFADTDSHPSTMIASGVVSIACPQRFTSLVLAWRRMWSVSSRSTWMSCTTTPPQSPSTASMPMPLREEKRGKTTRMAITWGSNEDRRARPQATALHPHGVRGSPDGPLQVASGNVVDDQTHCAAWDLLCGLTGRSAISALRGRLPAGQHREHGLYPSTPRPVPHRAAPDSIRGPRLPELAVPRSDPVAAHPRQAE